MAEIIAARFEELVEECRSGNASVLVQMRDLATWSARHPAPMNGLEASYRPDVTTSTFVIPAGECELYTIDRTVPNLEQSLLAVDLGLTPTSAGAPWCSTSPSRSPTPATVCRRRSG